MKVYYGIEDYDDRFDPVFMRDARSSDENVSLDICILIRSKTELTLSQPNSKA